MDAQSIAATVVSGGLLTAATDIDLKMSMWHIASTPLLIKTRSIMDLAILIQVWNWLWS